MSGLAALSGADATPIVFPAVDEPEATVIVLGWRSAPHLLGCLQALSRIDPSTPYEVVVTLNEPTEALLGSIKEHVRGATVISSRVNRGYGGACNAAAEMARGRYLVFLNDDAVVDRGWLRPLVEMVEGRPEIAAVGSMFLHMDGTLQESGSFLWSDGSTTSACRTGPDVAHRYDWARQIDYCSAASLLVTKAAWDRLGGFDEIYFPAYYEDVDLCLRIQEMGQQVWLQPASKVRHDRSASTVASYKTFLTLRNRKKLQQRWAGLLARRPELGDPEETAVWVAMGMPRRVLVIDDRVPAGWLGSGFGRMADALADLTADPGLFVSFYPAMTDDGPREVLSGHGIRVLHGGLRAHLEEPGVRYDAVMISRPHNYERFGSVVRKCQPDAVVVYDAEALYFRRTAKMAALAEDPAENERLRAEAAAMQRAEEGYFGDADYAVCITEEEAELARQAPGCAPVHVISAHLAAPAVTERTFRERRDVVLVAGWLAGPDSPNADGLRWFLRSVLPKLTVRLPWVRVRVTGANPPADLLHHASPNVVFEGQVEDLHAFYDHARVAMVPVRFGAGVKLKTIEALQYGVPVVATEVGAEGIDTLGTGALRITDDPGQFAADIAELLDDPAAWETQRQRVLDLHAQWANQPSGTTWHKVLTLALASRQPDAVGRLGAGPAGKSGPDDYSASVQCP